MIRRTGALVRFGHSRFNVAASDRNWADVTEPWARPVGFNASNPPARHARIHRLMMFLETVTVPPNDPGCPIAAVKARNAQKPRTVDAKLLRSGPPRPIAAGGTVSDYARAALDSVPDGEFAVIAHSAGGVVASVLVALAPDRVVGVLAIAAIIPAVGASFTSSLPFPNQFLLPLVLRLAGTRPPKSAIRKSLATGLPEETVRRLIADLKPEPLEYFTSRTSGQTALFGVPNKRYLITTEDSELPVALQRRFANRFGPSAVSETASEHLPMISHPSVVLNEIRQLTGKPPPA